MEPKRTPLILIAESQPALGLMLACNLETHGYSVAVANDGLSALDRVRSAPPPDLVLVDFALPSAIELCRTLQLMSATRNVPIIVQHDPADDARAHAAFDDLADELVPRPYPIRQLTARVGVLLQQRSQTSLRNELACGALFVDRVAHRVRCSGRTVDVSATDFALLSFLSEHCGRVFSRAELKEAVWGPSAIGLRTIDRHIRTLRRAIGQADDRFPLRTVSGVGYSLEC